MCRKLCMEELLEQRICHWCWLFAAETTACRIARSDRCRRAEVQEHWINSVRHNKAKIIHLSCDSHARNYKNINCVCRVRYLNCAIRAIHYGMLCRPSVYSLIQLLRFSLFHRHHCFYSNILRIFLTHTWWLNMFHIPPLYLCTTFT